MIMKRKCFNVFWSSLGAFVAFCWTFGIQNSEPAWAEAVLFFTITFLYLNKYDDRHMVIPVVLSMIAGREVLNVMLNIATLLHTGSLQPVYSWFVDFISVLGILSAALYYRWKRLYVLIGTVLTAILLIVFVQPVWLDYVKSYRVIL